MKTDPIRDLRQNWPSVERELQTSGGMLITRGSKPIARLLPLEDTADVKRKKFDPDTHQKWLQQTWGKTAVKSWVDDALAADRGEE